VVLLRHGSASVGLTRPPPPVRYGAPAPQYPLVTPAATPEQHQHFGALVTGDAFQPPETRDNHC